MKEKIVAASLCALAVSTQPSAAAQLNIDSVIVDSTSGRTFAAVCQNTRGYFAELGPRSKDARWVLEADFRHENVRAVLLRSVPAGWSLEFGSGLPQELTVDWSGRASWIDALAELSRKNNFVVVIAWVQKSVYLDKL